MPLPGLRKRPMLTTSMIPRDRRSPTSERGLSPYSTRPNRSSETSSTPSPASRWGAMACASAVTDPSRPNASPHFLPVVPALTVLGPSFLGLGSGRAQARCPIRSRRMAPARRPFGGVESCPRRWTQWRGLARWWPSPGDRVTMSRSRSVSGALAGPSIVPLDETHPGGTRRGRTSPKTPSRPQSDRSMHLSQTDSHCEGGSHLEQPR